LNLPGKRIWNVLISVAAVDNSWFTSGVCDYSSEVVSQNHIKVYYDINKTFDYDKPLLPNKEYRFTLTLMVVDIATGEHVSGNFGSVYKFKTGSQSTELPKPTVAGFNDVFEKDYYAEAVKWAVDNEITSGVDKIHFGPGQACTRAQAVTFLWRAAGSPEPTETENPFGDVKTGSYYEKAVLWAVENNVTAGTGAGRFSPNEACTRAQIVTFQYRAAGTPQISSGTAFTDVKPGSYYESAVQWAAGKNITSGTGNGKFSPDDKCTRAQIVSFLYRDRY